MIRLSVTMLDSYLYFLRNEEMEFDALLRRLRGEEPASPQMLAGHAFHSLLENAASGALDHASVDGFEFVFALDAEIALPNIRELKAEKLIETPSGPVTLVGKVDALDGITVRDYKLTERFDAERYVDSFQWRAYLMMFGAQRFVYDVFQCRYEAQRVTVYDYQALPFCAYPGMERDVTDAVAALAEIVVRHMPESVAA